MLLLIPNIIYLCILFCSVLMEVFFGQFLLVFIEPIFDFIDPFYCIFFILLFSVLILIFFPFELFWVLTNFYFSDFF